MPFVSFSLTFFMSAGNKLIIIIMKNIIMNIETKQTQDETHVQTFLKNYVIFTKLRRSSEDVSSKYPRKYLKVSQEK